MGHGRSLPHQVRDEYGEWGSLPTRIDFSNKPLDMLSQHSVMNYIRNEK